ncbi:MAG: sensor histidine kinase [Ktedonobacterales bacterium]
MEYPSTQAHSWEPGRRPWRLADGLRIVRRRQSYMNMLYLLMAFPLGLLYFLMFVIGFSVGTGLAFIGVGLLILLAMLGGAWWLGGFERELTMWWLDITIAPMRREQAETLRLTLWQRTTALLRNRITWTSLLYLLVKFPFGTLAFSIVFTLIALTAALLCAPLAAIIQAAVNGQLDTSQTISLLTSPLYFLVGVVVGVLTLYACDGLTWVWTQFARVTLGMSEAELQLTQARETATRAQVQAARAEQSRRELIVNVSHELRTPIASIRGHVESLQMAAEETPEADSTTAGGVASPAELRDYLAIISRESERLSALVDDLLSLARADAGELKLDLRPTRAGEVVEEVYESLAPLARRERQVTLVRQVAPDLPPVIADRQRLAQVLLNLVRNAITYTPTGGLVSLVAERADAGHVALTVADTGMGIPLEDQDRIFERFYRTDASRARVSGGFGLGLAIVRDLVQAMGGTVTVQSVEGEGSRFEVRLLVASGA